jgi:hypothetical protein
VQVEVNGFDTEAAPPKNGAREHAPVATASTSLEAPELQMTPSLDLTV